MREPLFLACDLGTSSVKAVVADASGAVRGAGRRPLETHVPEQGWAEQDPEDWWTAVAGAAQEARTAAGAAPDGIAALSFTGQMQGTLMVDPAGRPLGRCLIWLDARARREAREATGGLVRVIGYGPWRLLNWIRLANGAPSLTGKDPISKLLWLRKHRPEDFGRAHKLLDVKDAVLHRATGRYVTSADCAHLTWLMDARRGRRRWSPMLLRWAGVRLEQLPEIVASEAVVGPLTPAAAEALRLLPGTPVVAGAGDVAAMPLGAGAVRDGELLLALGTSAWVNAHVRGRRLDPFSYVASITSARDDREVIVATQECAGAALDWLARVLAPGGAPLGHAAFEALAEAAEPGSRSLLFLPWLVGERVPMDDPLARGAFLNLSLDHEPRHLARAACEGVALNARWALARVERLIGPGRGTLRLAGGVVRSDAMCRILADVLGREVARVRDPELAAARGAAFLAAKGVGALPSYDAIAGAALEDRRFGPRSETAARYDALFEAFTRAYAANRRLFARLNA